MLKFLKSLFVKPKAVLVVEPARGVIARKVSDLFTVTLEHTGGDNYEINTIGNLTKTGSGVYRNGKGKATNYFNSMCGLYGAK